MRVRNFFTLGVARGPLVATLIKRCTSVQNFYFTFSGESEESKFSFRNIAYFHLWVHANISCNRHRLCNFIRSPYFEKIKKLLTLGVTRGPPGDHTKKALYMSTSPPRAESNDTSLAQIARQKNLLSQKKVKKVSFFSET